MKLVFFHSSDIIKYIQKKYDQRQESDVDVKVKIKIKLVICVR